jgi:hypothetical protein
VELRDLRYSNADGPGDQRPLEERDDVLVYSTAVLNRPVDLPILERTWKHWHGGTATNRRSHIAIANVTDGKLVAWRKGCQADPIRGAHANPAGAGCWRRDDSDDHGRVGR